MIGLSVAQTVSIDPVGAVTAAEGTVLDITCAHADGVTFGSGIILRQNGEQLINSASPPNEVTGATRVFHLSVDRTQNGSTYNCGSVLTGMVSSVMTLTVTCKWSGQ